ncbi:MAG: DegT/DnrJ/EryC1/StrS family aminotransferase [Candidatus Woesearchaeota archaeon]
MIDNNPSIKKNIPTNMAHIGEEEIRAVSEILKENRLSVFTSEKIEKFEKNFSSYHQTKHAVALNSGTAALHSALLACDISKMDEVIVPVYTYAATALTVAQIEAKPVFVDIDPETLNIDLEKLESNITNKTKAIIPVHLFGNPIDMDHLTELAEKHDLKIIEDCAQALGATYNGKRVGTFGDVGCFSFQENKNITTGGEGGMVITKNDELADRIRIVSHEGEVYADKRSSARTIPGPLPIDYIMTGYNYRMNAIQAAIGDVQLSKLEKMNNIRKSIATDYIKALERDGISFQKIDQKAEHVFSSFVFRINKDKIAPRDMILMLLNSEGVPAYTYYPTPLNETKMFKDSNVFENAKKFCSDQILLPCYPLLKNDDQKMIIETINKNIDSIGLV